MEVDDSIVALTFMQFQQEIDPVSKAAPPPSFKTLFGHVLRGDL